MYNEAQASLFKLLEIATMQYCFFLGSEDTQINIGTQLRVDVEFLLLKRVECGPGRQYQVLEQRWRGQLCIHGR